MKLMRAPLFALMLRAILSLQLAVSLGLFFSPLTAWAQEGESGGGSGGETTGGETSGGETSGGETTGGETTGGETTGGESTGGETTGGETTGGETTGGETTGGETTGGETTGGETTGGETTGGETTGGETTGGETTGGETSGGETTGGETTGGTTGGETTGGETTGGETTGGGTTGGETSGGATTGGETTGGTTTGGETTGGETTGGGTTGGEENWEVSGIGEWGAWDAGEWVPDCGGWYEDEIYLLSRGLSRSRTITETSSLGNTRETTEYETDIESTTAYGCMPGSAWVASVVVDVPWHEVGIAPCQNYPSGTTFSYTPMGAETTHVHWENIVTGATEDEPSQTNTSPGALRNEAGCGAGGGSGGTGGGGTGGGGTGGGGGGGGAFAITSGGTATGTYGTPFSGYTVSSNGTGTITYSASSLPPGLTANSGNGVISGVPTSSGVFTATVSAANSTGAQVTRAVEFAIEKATPELIPGLFVEQIREGVASFDITPAMLPSAPFRHPAGFSPVPPSPVVYKGQSIGNGAVWDPAQGQPFTESSLVALDYFWSPLLVTAISPESDNYKRVEATVPFDAKDIAKPATPEPRVVLNSPTSFTVSWKVPNDNVGVTGYRVILDGTQTFYPAVATQLFSDLQPGSYHTVTVEARDRRGNWSDPASVSNTLLPAGSQPTYASQWIDIDNDGRRDEVLNGSDSIDIFELEVRTDTLTQSMWVQEFIQLPGTWVYYQAQSRFTESGFSYYPVYLPGEVIPTWTEEEESVDVEKVRVEFRFVVQDDYDYTVARVLPSNPDGGTRYLKLFPAGQHAAVGESDEIHAITMNAFWPTLAIYAFPIQVVKIGKPASGVEVELPSINGAVQISKGSASGTIKLPDGTTVTATTSSATIKLPNGTFIQTDGSGNSSLALPNGVSITAGPSGGTLSLPNGISVTVSGGNISLNVPQGLNAVLKNAVDALGTLLGGGNRGSVLGAVTPSPTSTDPIIWESATTGNGINLGNRSPGVYDVGTTADDRRSQTGQPTPATNNIVWIRLTVIPPPPALKSRDRFFAGSIDTSVDLYRLNSLEFKNGTTGESLGTFKLDGSAGTHIYNSEAEILSDTELDAVLGGSLNSGSPQFTQPVVFWRQSSGSSIIHFSTVFSAVGEAQILVKKTDGSVLNIIRRQLTSEPNFASLLTHFDARIKSLNLPDVASWSLLPPVNGIDDDDSFAASMSDRFRAMRVAPGIQELTKAIGAWQTNFLVKTATAADKAIDLNAPGVYALKIGGGFIKGYVDGLWDGLKSDVTGIVELGKMAVESLSGDFHRAKAMWDGIRSLAALDAVGREALFDSILQKFVARASVDVPWTPAGTDADEWGAAAYMSGYCGGFVTEQFLAICVGAGVVSKAGQAVKASFLASTAGQVTVAMVSNARRFVTASVLAAAKYVSSFSTNAVRAVREAMEDVAKRAVFQAKLVGDEVGALMERLGASQLTYQHMADRASLIALNEGDWLKILPTAQERLADLSVRLGAQFTSSGAKGFMEFWGRSMTVQNGGDYWANFLHACSTNGVVDSHAVARVAEMFDSASSATFKFTRDVTSPSKWISPGGWIYEQASLEGHRISHLLSHGTPNYVKPTGQPKVLHSVFSGPRQDIFRLVDDAWAKPKVHPVKNGIPDQNAWICDMSPQLVGTNGETKILIVVKSPGSRHIVTAFPIVP